MTRIEILRERISVLEELDPESTVWRGDVAKLLKTELADKRELVELHERLRALALNRALEEKGQTA